MREKEAHQRLIDCGIRSSIQRLAIMEYLLPHFTHPTVEDVYQSLCDRIPKLSRTTVYNTLRLFSEHHVTQMITIDDHHVCYDGNTEPHVHFLRKRCGNVTDLFQERAPRMDVQRILDDGSLVDDVQLYYKGVCAECRSKVEN